MEREGLKNLLPQALQWGSSDVDWCESNYKITAFIAEFYNTLSNVLFFVFPPLLIYLFRQYARQVAWGVNIVWVLLAVVGFGSVYFHATLSLVGQLVDELAIIWVFMAGCALWYPKRYMPVFLNQNRNHFKMITLFFTMLSSGLACVMPAINCMVLFVLGIPATVFMIIELKRTNSSRAFKLGLRCCLMWVIALFSWVSDRFMCSTWEKLGFPYLHCLWHIFIALASYQAIVLFAYFNARTEVPEQMPVLRYWPRDNFGVFGIPYVSLNYVGYKPTYKMF